MNIFYLSWRQWRFRPVSGWLHVLMLALGLGALGFILMAQERVAQALQRDVAGIDVVVGAKGSPLQLILAGVYHLDAPPGNIPLEEAQALGRHPQVAQWVPLSLGDSVAGFRVVGTTPAYLDWFGGELAQGDRWQAPLQAVLGAEVARRTGLRVGDTFAGEHGLAGGRAHTDHAFTVVGVLRANGSVLDRLVLTSTESVWQVHGLNATGLADDDHSPPHGSTLAKGSATARPAELAPSQASVAPAPVMSSAARGPEITLMLLRYRSPLAAATFPRWVNSQTALQAAAPAYELSRLLRLLGAGTEVLQALGLALLGVAGLGVFTGLWQAVRERRGDLAMLRLLGARPQQLAGLLLAEALWLAALASVLGVALAVGLMATLPVWLQADAAPWLRGPLWSPVLGAVPALAVAVAGLSAALPAWSAYRSDVASLLQAAD